MHRLGSSTVNWYLVEDDGRFTAVDAGLPGFCRSLESDLARLGASFESLDGLILTHSDGDHIGLARALHKAGARVLIHSADEDTLGKPSPKGGDASPVNTVREMWRPSFWAFIVSMMAGGAGRIRGVEGAETFGDGDTLDFQSLDALEPLTAEVTLFGHGDPWRGTVADAVQKAREKAGLYAFSRRWRKERTWTSRMTPTGPSGGGRSRANRD